MKPYEFENWLGRKDERTLLAGGASAGDICTDTTGREGYFASARLAHSRPSVLMNCAPCRLDIFRV